MNGTSADSLTVPLDLSESLQAATWTCDGLYTATWTSDGLHAIAWTCDSLQAATWICDGLLAATWTCVRWQPRIFYARFRRRQQKEARIEQPITQKGKGTRREGLDKIHQVR
ncbi:hypothetical protein B0I35DRAFT_434338 [Stachybotrys elegans]|uniref:Uncharacterized protein n=1 Tax=Stachybotrys elegans TaxID=80388 RepID=A0A8K0SV92_9HYPO|nr:hypothetical protein B0I35DRAFT_434338 [Stachybotrys elegans]